MTSVINHGHYTYIYNGMNYEEYAVWKDRDALDILFAILVGFRILFMLVFLSYGH